MSALLSVTDAHVAYGKVEAVRSVSLEVGQNQIVTIVGANGAGKTTLLSAIMGILPLKGRVVFAGQDLARADAHGHALQRAHPGAVGHVHVADLEQAIGRHAARPDTR